MERLSAGKTWQKMILFRIWRDFKSDQRQMLYLTATFVFFFSFVHFCLRLLWASAAAWGRSSCRAPASHCRRSPGRVGSGVEAQGLSCPAAGIIFLDQGPNPCPLHWRVDSLPLDHLGNSKPSFSGLTYLFKIHPFPPCPHDFFLNGLDLVMQLAVAHRMWADMCKKML